jgi:hypothetical protein
VHIQYYILRPNIWLLHAKHRKKRKLGETSPLRIMFSARAGRFKTRTVNQENFRACQNKKEVAEISLLKCEFSLDYGPFWL